MFEFQRVSVRILTMEFISAQALTLLDYILHAGSENVVMYFRDNIYVVKTLKEFVYVDEEGKDVGANVRHKAKDITNLLQDEDRLRNERRSRGVMRERMLGNIADSGLRGEDDFGDRGEMSSQPTGAGAWGGRPASPPHHPPPPSRSRDEDDDLARAIEESKRAQHDDDARARARSKEDDDLRRAIQMSEEEEAKRRQQLEDSNATALFNDELQLNANSQNQLVDVGWDSQQQPMQPQYTSYNVSTFVSSIYKIGD